MTCCSLTGTAWWGGSQGGLHMQDRPPPTTNSGPNLRCPFVQHIVRTIDMPHRTTCATLWRSSWRATTPSSSASSPPSWRAATASRSGALRVLHGCRDACRRGSSPGVFCFWWVGGKGGGGSCWQRLCAARHRGLLAGQSAVDVRTLLPSRRTRPPTLCLLLPTPVPCVPQRAAGPALRLQRARPRAAAAGGRPAAHGMAGGTRAGKA